MTRILTVFLASTIAVTVSAQTPAPKPSPLQGSWDMVSANGEAVPKEMTITLAIDVGGKYTATMNGAVNERGTIRADATKTPMTVDFLISEGSGVGKTQLGVAKIAGDTLTLHLNVPGAPARPPDFSALPQHDLIVLKKKV